MEKAKISAYQFFVLIIFFELGTALFLPVGITARQDIWLAFLVGMAGGFCLYLVYYGLYLYYPEIPLTEYAQKILGKALGRILAFLYVLYFMYLAARVVRDFGELLIINFFPDTPLFVVNALLVLVIMYTVSKGIEVLARTGELLFPLLIFIFLSSLLLLGLSGVIQHANIKPVLEEGYLPVLKTAFKETLYFPFGEVLVFAMILPYLNRPKKAKQTGLFALAVSGLILALTKALNVSVLGVDLVQRSDFPLLSAIQTIEVAEFLERLDIFFLLTTLITVFFKVSVYFYAAVTGAANLFAIKKSSQLVYPFGAVLLFLSITMASNYTEHIQEGLHIVPLYMHLPFQVIIPAFFLVIAFFKNKNKTGQNKPEQGVN
ncbi:spore germination protein [Domibacillus sp. A3M-37]|uniref:GerAB/ArcD/ProY family transporter n=1 Tax=Domibacillus sp. A3M-37 TaxID=2962037 RepID=UPI0020B6BAD6|nr:GerAB/ArcD/ProY family transporter [Domibacillus sp. A3M-37]MCP3764767.1 spore germination protein [Domibacillus sp. A3M-37]